MRSVKTVLLNNITNCKFPKEINNIKEFIEYINDKYNSFVALDTFSIDGCVEPFFIEDTLKTETEYFNTSLIRNIKEHEIYILREWEYEEKLKKLIEERCTKCISYTNNECQQDGSFRGNLCLNGECWAFEKKK